MWQLSAVPTGFYWDEIDLTYQAYSILKTGKDYFGNSLPIHFHSFADFFPPLYIYLKVPLIALFGLSDLNIRLLSALSGIVSIILIYFVVKQLTQNKIIGLLSSVMLAISPWHIQYSRIGFAVSTMLVFFLIGLYGFLRGLKNPKWLILSSLGFGLTAWVYSTAELFVPLFIFGLLILYWRDLLKLPRKYLAWSGFILIVLFAIILFSSFFGKGNQRLNEISIFNDPQMSSQIMYLRQQAAVAGGKTGIGVSPSIGDKISYNKPLFIANTFWQNYISAFSTDFLYISGDPNVRQSAQTVGEFYRIDLLALLFGIGSLALLYYGKENRLANRKIVYLLLFWVFSAPLATALTRDGAGHATRLFFLLPALIIIMSIGLYYFYTYLPKKLIWLIGVYGLILAFQVFVFYQNYFTVYRFASAPVYEYGFTQAVQKANQISGGYDKVIFDSNKDSLLMAYLFVNKYSPQQFQKQLPNLHVNLTQDIVANSLGNSYILNRGGTAWDLVTQNRLKGKYLIFVSANNILQPDVNKFVQSFPEVKSPNSLKLLDTIFYPNGLADFYVISYENYTKTKN